MGDGWKLSGLFFDPPQNLTQQTDDADQATVKPDAPANPVNPANATNPVAPETPVTPATPVVPERPDVPDMPMKKLPPAKSKSKEPFSASWMNRLFANNKAVWILMLVVLTGLLLIAFTRCSSTKKQTETSQELDSYTKNLEDRMTGLLDRMEGVDSVSVMITLESGSEIIYTSRNQQIAATKEPKVKGVLVVCEGGGDVKIRERVIEAVSTALGIGWNQVSVQARG